MNNMRPSLAQLYSSHSGNISDKWDIYLHIYNRILTRFLEKEVNLLEIGVQNGGSLEIWEKFFQNAKCILGCDINPACEMVVYDSKKISIIVGDANSDATVSEIDKKCSKFDIIIDDGSHASADIITSFLKYFPRLNYDGVYIVEDLHCSYWTEFDGGLAYQKSSMNFLKRLSDVINHEHWGNTLSRTQYLEDCSVTPELLNEEVLADIHSIEFVNSMCIINKRPPAHNVLGARHVVGVRALVVDNKSFDATYSTPPPQKP
jgi:hypothetical protein